MKKIMSTFIIAGIGGLVAIGGIKLFEKNSNSASNFAEKQAINVNTVSLKNAASAIDFTAVSAISTPAVVHIKTMIAVAQNPRQQQFDLRDFFGDGFEMPEMPRGGGGGSASGSGVIISKDGYIATNNHVVDGATTIEVILNDNRSYYADVIGTDPSTDLALIKIKEDDLPFLNFGNSDVVKVGEWVLAVGNPFNLTSTVTAGIVSAMGRNINLIRENNQYAVENFIQTDAAVNPGNSGGALVNMNGELIGINTAIASQTGSFAGYSFAVPVNIVKKVMDDLLKYGVVQRGFLGIEIRDIDAQLATEKDLKQYKGVYTAKVNEKGAAATAGIKEGDVITKINDAVVNTSSQLQEQVSRLRPGDKVNITYQRKNKEMTTVAILKNRDGEIGLIKAEEKVNKNTYTGIEMSALENADKENAKTRIGVKIKITGNGPFKEAGVPNDFIVTKIDKSAVYTPSDLKKRLESAEGGVLIEGVTKNGEARVFGLNIDK